uniref:Uncharacterized protein n=1 Tax=Solanum tuberosum TaxID=4113 RepID=M1AVT2_SOLTU
MVDSIPAIPEFLLFRARSFASPRVLERRESGKNLSYSVTEKSNDSSVTQGDMY